MQPCESLSKTWHGRCRSTRNCDRHCRNQEKAEHGACHGFWHKKCYCYISEMCLNRRWKHIERCKKTLLTVVVATGVREYTLHISKDLVWEIYCNYNQSNLIDLTDLFVADLMVIKSHWLIIILIYPNPPINGSLLYCENIKWNKSKM
jgi:hypothetical protein